jgi:hypothetical protein
MPVCQKARFPVGVIDHTELRRLQHAIDPLEL